MPALVQRAREVRDRARRRALPGAAWRASRARRPPHRSRADASPAIGDRDRRRPAAGPGRSRPRCTTTSPKTSGLSVLTTKRIASLAAAPAGGASAAPRFSTRSSCGAMVTSTRRESGANGDVSHGGTCTGAVQAGARRWRATGYVVGVRSSLDGRCLGDNWWLPPPLPPSSRDYAGRSLPPIEPIAQSGRRVAAPSSVAWSGFIQSGRPARAPAGGPRPRDPNRPSLRRRTPGAARLAPTAIASATSPSMRPVLLRFDRIRDSCASCSTTALAAFQVKHGL